MSPARIFAYYVVAVLAVAGGTVLADMIQYRFKVGEWPWTDDAK